MKNNEDRRNTEKKKRKRNVIDQINTKKLDP